MDRVQAKGPFIIIDPSGQKMLEERYQSLSQTSQSAKGTIPFGTIHEAIRENRCVDPSVISSMLIDIKKMQEQTKASSKRI